jgi:hypothetical protein
MLTSLLSGGQNYSAGSSTYEFSAGTKTQNEGTSFVFTLNTTNVLNGTTLYYSLEAAALSTSDITAADFTGGLTGSFTTTGSATSLSIATAQNNTTFEGPEWFIVKVYTDAARTVLVASSDNVTAQINDTATGFTTTATISYPTSNVYMSESSTGIANWTSKPVGWYTGHGTNTTDSYFTVTATNIEKERLGSSYVYVRPEYVGLTYDVTVGSSTTTHYGSSGTTPNGNKTIRGYKDSSNYNYIIPADYFPPVGGISTNTFPGNATLYPKNANLGATLVRIADLRWDGMTEYYGAPASNEYGPNVPPAGYYQSVIQIYHPQGDPGGTFLGKVSINGSLRVDMTSLAGAYPYWIDNPYGSDYGYVWDNSTKIATWYWSYNYYHPIRPEFKGLFWDISTGTDVKVFIQPVNTYQANYSYISGAQQNDFADYINDNYPHLGNGLTLVQLTGSAVSSSGNFNYLNLSMKNRTNNQQSYYVGQGTEGPETFKFKIYKDSLASVLLGTSDVAVTLCDTTVGTKAILNATYPRVVNEWELGNLSSYYSSGALSIGQGVIELTTVNCTDDDVIHWMAVDSSSTINSIVRLRYDFDSGTTSPNNIGNGKADARDFYNRCPDPWSSTNESSSYPATYVQSILLSNVFDENVYEYSTVSAPNNVTPLRVTNNIARMGTPAVGNYQGSAQLTERTESFKLAFFIKKRVQLYTYTYGLLTIQAPVPYDNHYQYDPYAPYTASDMPPYSGYPSTPAFLTEDIYIVDSNTQSPTSSSYTSGTCSFTLGGYYNAAGTGAGIIQGIIKPNVDRSPYWVVPFYTGLGTFPASTTLTGGPYPSPVAWLTSDTLQTPSFLGCYILGEYDYYGVYTDSLKVVFAGDVRGSWWKSIEFGGRTINVNGDLVTMFTNWAGYTTPSQLPMTGNTVGDGYFLTAYDTTSYNGILYVWNGSAWIDNGCPTGKYYPANTLFEGSVAQTVWEFRQFYNPSSFNTYFTSGSTTFKVNYRYSSEQPPGSP